MERVLRGGGLVPVPTGIVVRGGKVVPEVRGSKLLSVVRGGRMVLVVPGDKVSTVHFSGPPHSPHLFTTACHASTQ